MARVRVVAGTARGRKIEVPLGDRVRPTADRVREAVGNSLGSIDAIVDARVLDLFAGSGALGIEALSRGAASVDFVEPDRNARSVIAQNLQVLEPTRRAATQVIASTAEQFLSGCSVAGYDLVFLDPPYAFDDWPGLLGRLDLVVSPDGVIVVESDREIDVARGWEIHRAKRYGGTVVTIHVRAATSPLISLSGAQE